jgi:cytochrome c-type biogenesis protein CcmH
MTMWLILGALCLVAVAFAIWPLYRDSGHLPPVLAAVIVLVVGSSAALYLYIGQPGVPSGAGAAPDVGEMVNSLSERLAENPDDIQGWLILGRSQQALQQYDEAIVSFERALQLDKGQNAQTLLALAIALMEQQGGEMTDRSSSLFESALALESNNANALFYGGGAAARRGDVSLAADRWEILLGLNAPDEIQALLQRKINEWRGLPPVEDFDFTTPVAIDPAVADGPIVVINISLSEEAISVLPADANVCVIARAPGQPSPPIAVARRQLADFPTLVGLSDRDAMIPNRKLSSFAEFEIVARATVSGQPIAQSGDWSGSLIVSANSGQTIDLLIDQKIP